VIRWGPALVWAALIFTFSSFSKLPAPPGALTDKHAHLIVYGVFGALLVWGLTDRAPSRTTWRTVGTAVAVALVYGLSDEFHQSFVPGRDVSGLDVAADVIGAAIAAIGLRAWAIIRARA
jgi:VanZ family protein